MHLKKRVPGRKPGSFRKTVAYTYNSAGRITEKSGTYNNNTVEYLVYDDNNRLITDSVRSTDVNEGFNVITKYEYNSEGYREYAWMSERKYPAITEYKLDSHGRTVEQSLWFHKDDDNGSCRNILHTNWKPYLNNDLKQYKQFERAVTKYDEWGRVSRTYYYFEGKHTTTHEFEYEKPGLTQKM